MSNLFYSGSGRHTSGAFTVTMKDGAKLAKQIAKLENGGKVATSEPSPTSTPERPRGYRRESASTTELTPPRSRVPGLKKREGPPT